MRRFAFPLLLILPLLALGLAGPRLVGHALFALGFRLQAAPLLGDPAWRAYALGRSGDWRGAAAAFGTAPANAYNRGNALAHAGLFREALDACDDALDADPDDSDARYNKAIVEKILDKAATPPGTTRGNANASARTERHHGGAGNANGETNSVGIGFVGNKEGGTNSGAQGGSKVAKMGRGQTADSGDNNAKASGSAGQAGGKGRTGGDLVDITTQLALNQRRYSPVYELKAIEANVEWLQTVPDNPGEFLKLQIRAERKRREALAARGADDD